jgi:hypothetical protein
MALIYSAVKNFYSPVTLPSRESIHVLRDPPKSIHTRRIDKVGDTNAITDMIDGSGNRACEAINVFARGVNPSVSVSYTNAGNNGGQLSGGLQANGGRSAYMPNKLMDKGSFRPPIRPLESLYPLSRMPRLTTSALTTPGFVDYSKSADRCSKEAPSKTIKLHSLKASIRPTATYNIQTPSVEPFEVKYMIQDHLKTSASSGTRTIDLTELVVAQPLKGVTDEPLHAWIDAMPINSKKHVENHTLDTDRYIQDPLAHSAYTNLRHDVNVTSINDATDLDTNRYIQDSLVHSAYTNLRHDVNVTSINDAMDLGTVRVKDTVSIDYKTPLKGYEVDSVIHDDLKMDRNLPTYSTTTNIAKNIYKNVSSDSTLELVKNTPLTSYMAGNLSMRGGELQNINATLPKRLNIGGYQTPSNMPMTERNGTIPDSYDSHKYMLAKSAASQRSNKFSPHI